MMEVVLYRFFFFFLLTCARLWAPLPLLEIGCESFISEHLNGVRLCKGALEDSVEKLLLRLYDVHH